jgi:hypothetical protein
MVWSQVKRELARKNKTFKISEVEGLMNEELGRVTEENWASCVRHAENLQEEDFAEEIGRNEILETIFINLQDGETEDDERDEDDSDVTVAEGIYDDDDDDTPLAFPLD